MTRETQDALIESAQRHLTNNYKQQRMVLTGGEGCFVWDVAGQRYLDMTAGIAVSCLGHGHPKLAAVIAAQAARLIHVSNLYYIEPQIRLAEALCMRSFARRGFFCN